MADFCKQCSIEIFGGDFRELAGLISQEQAEGGLIARVLCEGCGPTQVNIEGECLFHEKAGGTQQSCLEHAQKKPEHVQQ